STNPARRPSPRSATRTATPTSSVPRSAWSNHSSISSGALPGYSAYRMRSHSSRSARVTGRICIGSARCSFGLDIRALPARPRKRRRCRAAGIERAPEERVPGTVIEAIMLGLAPQHSSILSRHGEPMSTTRSNPILAYRDQAFLDSDDGRPLRILAEYLQPLHAFRREGVEETVVFFGSARLREDGPLGRYYAEARELARRLTEWSLSLQRDPVPFVVCTGGGGGIMEAANRGAADAGGRTIGLNIGLPHEQRPNPYISPGLGF